LYKIGETYYLLIAEGGTSYDHEVTVARASSPWGPFDACARNPILTHKQRRSHPIQATGHADWVQAANGSWWMVFLGIRPWDGAHHHLGRETFLTPITWDREGWPVVSELEAEPVGADFGQFSRDDFDGPALGFEWNFVRNPVAANYSLSERSGFLRLRGAKATLDDEAAFTFVGRRQQHHRCEVSANVEFEPRSQGQTAGLMVRADEKNHYDLVVHGSDRGRRVTLQSRIRGERVNVGEVEVMPGPLVLGIEAHPERYEFFVKSANGTRRKIGSLPTNPLASELTGGFTGAYFGLFAVDESGASTAADFDWFDYQPAREE
jgi:xylan 1,4-beta-xylosidase